MKCGSSSVSLKLQMRSSGRKLRVQPVDESVILLCLPVSKCYTPESMPPSSDAAQYHIQRANHQSLIWREACNSKPVIPSPTDSGWKLADGILTPVLSYLPPIPKACKDIVECGCTKGCISNRCSGKK